MTTLVERVARAMEPELFSKVPQTTLVYKNGKVVGYKLVEIPAATRARISQALDKARAAISAMREPTEAMIDAAWLKTRTSSPADIQALRSMPNQMAFEYKMRHRYIAMIAAALHEKDSP